MDERQRPRPRDGAQPVVLRLRPLSCRDARTLNVEGTVAQRDVLLGHLPRCRISQEDYRQAPLHMDAPRRGQGHDVVDWYRGLPLHRRGR